MEAVQTEVVTLERTRDAKGRRLFKKETRERLLAEYDANGLTQAAFARREGIKYMTFVTWLQYRHNSVWPSKASEKCKRIEFARVAMPTQKAQGGKLEVVLTDGTRIVGERIEDLAALLRLLRK
jgi:transposase-like protein